MVTTITAWRTADLSIDADSLDLVGPTDLCAEDAIEQFFADPLQETTT